MSDLLLGLAVGASVSSSVALWVIADKLNKLTQISHRFDDVSDTLWDLARNRQENEK